MELSKDDIERIAQALHSFRREAWWLGWIEKQELYDLIERLETEQT